MTFSGPGWASILHGVHRDKHAVTSNNYQGNNLSQWPDILTRVKTQCPHWITARYSTWDSLHLHQPTTADINVFHAYSTGGDAKVTQEAVELLAGRHPMHPDGPHVIFFYLADVDIAGHNHGFSPSVPAYLTAIEVADQQFGRLLSEIEQRNVCAGRVG